MDQISVAADDGRKRYVFSATGRHLRTEDTFTGAKLYEFSYTNGRLSQITDVHGNMTTIERDGNGQPQAIVAPFGQHTTLRLDANGYIDRITNPAGEFTTFTYTQAGLMTTMTDARQHTFHFTYDPAGTGRLIKDEDPAGGFTALARTGSPSNYEVTKTTALGRVTKYQMERLVTGAQRQLVTLPDSTQNETMTGPDGSNTSIYPDGTVIFSVQTPDPRSGMLASVSATATTTAQGGLTATTTTERTVTLADPNNPVSLVSQTDTNTLNGRTFTTGDDTDAQSFLGVLPKPGEQRQMSPLLHAHVIGIQQKVDHSASWSRWRLTSVK